jgi:phosphatidylglycerol:prolipoprotein diacylglycerol transferase
MYIPYPDWISPIIIPGLPFRWYGLMYLVAFVLTYLLVRVQVRERDLRVSDEITVNLFFWAIVGMLIGARIFATTIYATTGIYLERPWLIFWPFNEEMQFTGLQGMSYHGGLVGVLAAVLIYCRVKRLDMLVWGDMLVAAVPLGYTFGRLGNFINAELYGRVTTAPWGVLFPGAQPVPANHEQAQAVAEAAGIPIANQDQYINLPRHPSQLYEAFLEGVLLWLLMWFLFRPRASFRGYLISVYLIGYGVARFIAEYFRQPDPGLDFIIQLSPGPNPPWLLQSPLNFTTGHIMSAVMIAAGVVCYFLFRWWHSRGPKISTFEEVPPE